MRHTSAIRFPFEYGVDVSQFGVSTKNKRDKFTTAVNAVLRVTHFIVHCGDLRITIYLQPLRSSTFIFIILENKNYNNHNVYIIV